MFFEWDVKAALNHLNYQILKQGESNKTGFQVGSTIPTCSCAPPLPYIVLEMSYYPYFYTLNVIYATESK